MRSLLKFILFIVVFANAHANIIDFECKITRWGESYQNFLKNSGHDNSVRIVLLKTNINNNKKWWQFWEDYDDKLFFSIDVSKQKVLYPDFYNSIILITPDTFTIATYLQCQGSNIMGCKGLVDQYVINRITGEISGDTSTTDNTYLPYFKEGQIIYSFYGSCEAIKRKF